MCVCKEEDPCGDNCQNRVMLYECDKTNCKFEPDVCQNRAFTRLQERTKQGGKYRIGVEVVKTDEKGYGIRANRSFHANQIIMEYTGEIITEEECDRRMNEVYKDNKVGPFCPDQHRPPPHADPSAVLLFDVFRPEYDH